jgi:predicted transposase YbfD/YdcC
MIEGPQGVDFLTHFSKLPDSREFWKVQHPLAEILLLCLCAVISGADGIKDIATYGKTKLDFLRQFSPFTHGSPSESTIGRLLANLNPKAFQSCFIEWVQGFQKSLQGVVVNLDGKQLRHSFDTANAQSPLHLISAWVGEHDIVLGQEAVKEKSNEITAIPELLKLLEIKGAIITIDAMGCQKKIAKTITDQKADYVLALKENQKTLENDVVEFFQQQLKESFRHSHVDRHQTLDKGHGRIERRTYYSTSDVDWLKQYHGDWSKLNSIGMVESQRTEKGETSTERRYYISSLPEDAKLLAKAVRGHWGIENTLHWILDMVFREDECRVRKDHAPRNLGTIRHMGLNLIRKVKDKCSVRTMRKLAGWDEQTLMKILCSTESS